MAEPAPPAPSQKVPPPKGPTEPLMAETPIIILPKAENAPSFAPQTSPLGHDADESIVDLGWHENPENVEHLIDGISNEDVFTLVRRFNKVVWYLKDAPSPSVKAGGLDLAVASDQEFAPNKMRAQMERLYISVVGASDSKGATGSLNSSISSWCEP